VLSLSLALVGLGRSRPSLALGAYSSFDAGPNVLGYLRTHGNQRDLVLLNVGSARERIMLPSGVESVELLLSTSPDRSALGVGAELGPDEAVVLAVCD
jgi:hypothetical protein